jgi:hypothetical protein
LEAIVLEQLGLRDLVHAARGVVADPNQKVIADRCRRKVWVGRP